MSKILRWLSTNLRLFILAFILALAFWVMAVNSSDPDKTGTLPQPVAIEYVGQDSGLVMTGDIPETVEVTLQAPESAWEQLIADPASVRAIVDLTGRAAGTHKVEVVVQVTVAPVRIISISPTTVTLTLEPLSTLSLPITLSLTGEPAIGFQAGEAVLTPSHVAVSGPESIVSRVVSVRVNLDLTEARAGIDTTLSLVAYDAGDDRISGLTLSPPSVQISLPVMQLGGYRDLAVKVVTIGRVAGGYRIASVSAFPAIVTVYSANSAIIEALPGYVETTFLDLSGASENIETRLGLILPADVTLVGEQTVLVQVGISPIQDSLTVTYRPVEITGLAPGLKAQASPVTVDVILFGPIPALESLLVSQVHVSVDASGYGVGTYQLTPTVTIEVGTVFVQSILPSTVQVTITGPTTPTP